MPAPKPAVQDLLDRYVRWLHAPIDGPSPEQVREILSELEAAKRTAPAEVRSTLFGAIGRCLTLLGRAEQALSAYRNAQNWASSDPDPARPAQTENNLAVGLHAAGYLDEALRHATSARNLALSPVEKAFASLTEAIIRFDRHEAAQCRQMFEAASSLTELCGKGATRVLLHYRLAVNGAAFGLDVAAVEQLARFLAAHHGVERDPNEPVAMVLDRYGEDARRVLAEATELREAVGRICAGSDRGETVAKLISEVKAAASSAEPEDALELIYTEVDALLRHGAFPEVDDLLDAVDTSSLPVVHLLAFVSITSAADDRLSARRRFITRVRDHLAKVEPDRAEELLAGFE